MIKSEHFFVFKEKNHAALTLVRDLAILLLVLAVVSFVAMAATLDFIFFASASATLTGTRFAITFIGSE